MKTKRYLELCHREDHDITLESVQEEIAYIDDLLDEAITKMTSAWYAGSKARDVQDKLRTRIILESVIEDLKEHRQKLVDVLFEIQKLD
jgi:hypothetical protein